MACANCPREGHAGIPPLAVVGWKIWYGNETVSLGTTLIDWMNAPTTAVQIVLLYYNRFSTDGTTRYRRILHGNDRYFAYLDPVFQELVYGQTNESAVQIEAAYPGASVKTGALIPDGRFRTLLDLAIMDMRVSDFGLVPEGGTSET